MARLLTAGCAMAILAIGTPAYPETTQGDVQNGRAVYESHCIRCHGPALDGHGPEASKLVKRPANFHDLRSRRKGDAELEIIVKTGQTFTDMHRWRDELTDAQVRDVIAYIRASAPHVIE